LAGASAFAKAGKKDLGRYMVWRQNMGPVAEDTLKFDP
jgi:hypothetical protein